MVNVLFVVLFLRPIFLTLTSKTDRTDIGAFHSCIYVEPRTL